MQFPLHDLQYLAVIFIKKLENLVNISFQAPVFWWKSVHKTALSQKFIRSQASKFEIWAAHSAKTYPKNIERPLGITFEHEYIILVLCTDHKCAILACQCDLPAIGAIITHRCALLFVIAMIRMLVLTFCFNIFWTNPFLIILFWHFPSLVQRN